MDTLQILSAAAANGDVNATAMLAKFNENPALARLMSRHGDKRDVRVERILEEACGDGKAPALRALRASSGSTLFGPSAAAVHVNVGLPTQLNVYKNRKLIADEVLPVAVVQKEQDKIWEVPLATLQSVSNLQIAGSRAKPNEIPWTVDATLSYACVPYGLIDPTPLEVLLNADAPIQPRKLSAMIVKNFLDLAREIRVANATFNSGNYGTNTAALTGAARWDNPASDPIGAIVAAKELVFCEANVLVLGAQVWTQLRTHPQVMAYVKFRAGTALGATPAIMEQQYLAEMLGLEAVIVGRAKLLTSNENAATQTTGYVWGKSAALLRVEPEPTTETSSFGFTYRFRQAAYRSEVILEQIRGLMGVEFLKMTHSDAEKVLLPPGAGAHPAGYLWTTVVS